MASSTIPIPDEKLLKANYEELGDERLTSRKISFHHRYFSDTTEVQVSIIRDRFNKNRLLPDDTKSEGGAFLPGRNFENVSITRLGRIFGTDFIASMDKLELKRDRWIGPVASIFGFHLLWITSEQVPRLRTFEELRSKLEREALERTKKSAVSAWVTKRMERYEVRRS